MRAERLIDMLTSQKWYFPSAKSQLDQWELSCPRFAKRPGWWLQYLETYHAERIARYKEGDLQGRLMDMARNISAAYESAYLMPEYVRFSCWTKAEPDQGPHWEQYLGWTKCKPRKINDGVIVGSTIERLLQSVDEKQRANIRYSDINYVDYEADYYPHGKLLFPEEATGKHQNHLVPYMFKHKAYNNERELRVFLIGSIWNDSVLEEIDIRTKYMFDSVIMSPLIEKAIKYTLISHLHTFALSALIFQSRLDKPIVISKSTKDTFERNRIMQNDTASGYDLAIFDSKDIFDSWRREVCQQWGLPMH